MEYDKHILLGKTIKKVYLNKEKTGIQFVTSDNDSIIANCDADCCSHTWIEDLINLDAIIDTPILKVEDIELPKEFETKTKTDNYEEEMKYYGFAIETAKGKFTLAYRNSSNGYYGGWLTWSDNVDKHYGGVYGQNNPNSDWNEVK